jgi:hypothetical protein
MPQASKHAENTELGMVEIDVAASQNGEETESKKLS